MRIVLASTSRHRRMLLDRAGIPYEAMAPACDEKLHQRLPPAEATRELALRKAHSLVRARPDALIIGSDQMAVLDGRVLEKPGSEDRAVSQLLGLSGRTHELWTAVALIDAGGSQDPLTHVELWRMTMRGLTEKQARAYVRADSPLDCAGSYRFESMGVRLFERVEGDDPSAITGLPLMALCSLLQQRGVPLELGMVEVVE